MYARTGAGGGTKAGTVAAPKARATAGAPNAGADVRNAGGAGGANVPDAVAGALNDDGAGVALPNICRSELVPKLFDVDPKAGTLLFSTELGSV